ncbi:cyclin-dependent kinase 11B [Penicillium mononematosum]|uniref:cyclin-dependent kinase 11B n=1 Tax=Penicillium mononematosum TaxID=268346 RepID=UPI0025471CC0|nr:cyclin-dependent kinase 11B [Penicillium mononematosum]KAJ6183720.1 cyclin-dependent kinase 11B [Penicillium mononematosum]
MLYLTFAPFSSAYKGGVITGMVECLGPLPSIGKASTLGLEPQVHNMTLHQELRDSVPMSIRSSGNMCNLS